MSATSDSARFPLLDSLLEIRGLKREAVYTVKTTAAIFDVSPRTIDDWCCEGKMVPRDLPGHGRFLNEDFEEFLQLSRRGRKKRENEAEPSERNDDDEESRSGVRAGRRRNGR